MVLIGNGMSGFKFCEKFLKYGVNKKYDLVVFGEEYFPAYDRVNLTKYIHGTPAANLYLAPVAWYANNGITLHTNEKVSELNTVQQWIKTSKGKTETYDKLIFATGSKPYVPANANLQLPGVFVYRTIKDLDSLKKYSTHSKRAIIAGGGVLGLEAAAAMQQLRLKVTITERNQALMHRQLDETASGMVKNAVEASGIEVLLNTTIGAIEGSEKVTGVTLSDGALLETDMVIYIAGITPNDELASNSGIITAKSGGIVVNNYGLSSNENVYAIGECVSSYNRSWGLVLPCYEMAEVLAARFGGIFKAFSGKELFTKLKMSGLNLVCFGDSNSLDGLQFSQSNAETGTYKRLNTDNSGNILTGGILLGDTSMFLPLLQMLRNKTRIDDPSRLIEESLSLNEMGLQAMPDSTKICHCTGVTKGTILKSIKELTLTRFDEVRLHTGAGTGCESCTSSIEELLEIVNNQSN